jgi:hypothetical protein
MYARSSGRMLLSIVRMYEGGTARHMLCKPYRQTYVGQADIRGTSRRTLLFEYLLVNTWTY